MTPTIGKSAAYSRRKRSRGHLHTESDYISVNTIRQFRVNGGSFHKGLKSSGRQPHHIMCTLNLRLVSGRHSALSCRIAETFTRIFAPVSADLHRLLIDSEGSCRRLRSLQLSADRSNQPP